MPTVVSSQPSSETDPWATLPDNFHFVLFERVNVAENEARYYWLAWQPTLLGWGVVRLWGRKGETQHIRVEPFSSLPEAWPTLRSHIRTRLRHGYQIVDLG